VRGRAAVANLTLITARSDAATVDQLWLVLSLLVAILAMLSVIVGRVAINSSNSPNQHRHLYVAIPHMRPLRAVSRPRF
jgi:hypothetical protein